MKKRLGVRRTVAVAICVMMAAAIAAAGSLPVRSAAKQAGGSVSDPDAAALNALLAKARSAMDGKDYAAAAQAYEDYLLKKPDDAAAHFQLGYAYTALRQIDDARAQYEKATELDPEMGEAFLNLGLTELNSNPAAAVAALRKATELMPGEAHPMAVLGAALEHSGKTAEAIDEYKAAEAIDSQDFEIHFALGNALLRSNRAPDAEQEFRAAIALDANDPQGHLGLGECLIAEKKFDDGATELAAYLKAQPGDARARLVRASALIDAAKYDEALAELDRASASAPDSLLGFKLRYEALAALKRPDDAVAALMKAESIAPADAEVHAKLGQAYFDQKNYPAAAREYQAALKIAPDEQVVAALVAAAYAAGDCAGALQAINLQAQQPSLPLRSLFIRASCYDKLGKKAEALGAYEAFLAANKDQASDMYFAAAERVRDLRRELGNRK